MEYQDMKIDYTKYLEGKREESNRIKKGRMQMRVLTALREISPHVEKDSTLTYYADGTCAVSYCGSVFGIYDTNKERWFGGYVGS